VLIPSELGETTYPVFYWSHIGRDDYLKPNEYLQDAIDDLKSGSERRNFNNAVRNAKSALHMKVDILCRSFCGEEYFRKNMRNFPQKMDFLEGIGIVRPRIIDKINKMRNEIEHEYRDATLEEAEDFIDIVLLFVEATKYLNLRFPSDIDFHGSPPSKEGYLRKLVCKWESGELALYYSKQSQGSLANMDIHFIKVGDDRYNYWVRYLLENCD
jgi:hypothetical protein